MKKLKLFLISIAFIALVIIMYLIPAFLNFMETQKDILKISQHIQIFQINNNSTNLENIKVSFNIPIPEEIRIKMEKEKKEKEELKRQEELIKQQEEKIRQEEKRKIEELKIAEQKQIQTTSRSSIEEREDSEGEYIKFTATAYCPCSSCCGKTTGITASGVKAQAGVTVAMPSKYAFGTQIQIKGMGTYIVQDRGGAIQGNKIDIFFNTHQEALNFGRKTVYLKIL